MKKAYFAGGCFWCVEHDLESVPGVADVVSGYAAAEPRQHVPTYENHNGFREAVEVAYDESLISFRKLSQIFLEHIDPTDDSGQFADRGESYKTAIYYNDEDEKAVAESLLAELQESGLFDKPIVVEVLPLAQFYSAEDYHQNYASENPVRYGMYRQGSGRGDFIANTCKLREEKNIVWKKVD